MGESNKIGEVAAAIGKFVLEHIGKAIGVFAVSVLAGGWTWAYLQFNPSFSYGVFPSSDSTKFVSLTQILNQIEKDSHFSCSGGWSQRIGFIGLRKCYKFTFAPISTYRIIVCTHDQRSHSVSSSDQLFALRFFQERFSPLECYRTASDNGESSYKVTLGKDSQLRRIQFANDPPEDQYFCGCGEGEIRAIIRAIGAKSH